jgi:hypothetical protein
MVKLHQPKQKKVWIIKNQAFIQISQIEGKEGTV